MMSENRADVAQEFVEILTHRAQRSGASPAQMLREHHQHLASLAKLTSDTHFEAVLAELDQQATRLELNAVSKPKVLICT